MSLGAIGPHDIEITLDHLQVGMSQQNPQRENVTIISQVIDGEGVPKAMGMNVRDTRPLVDPLHQSGEVTRLQRPGIVLMADDEERFVWIRIVKAHRHIAPDGLRGPLPQLNDTLLLVPPPPFPSNVQRPSFQIDVLDTDITQLRATNTGVEQ